MTGPTVVILSPGDATAAGPAIASAAALGLPVVVGVTGQRAVGAFDPAVRVVPVTWREDFADARNQVLDQVDAPWLLWLDDDERLVACAADLECLSDAAYGVWIRDRADLTPRPIVRLQRHAAGARWAGAVHEMLTGLGDGDPVILDGVVIEHDGYADTAILRAKRERNHALAVAARRRGEDSWVLALEDARYAEATGCDAFRAWLAAFNHPEAAPARPGGHDGRVEAAVALAAMGYVTPARLLLAENPGIVPLALALLVAEVAEGREDGARLDALARRLGGGFDRRYAFPVVL